MIRIRPCELKEANAFIAAHHRHHKPVVGHRFSVRAIVDEKTVGVAIAGRPVSRGCDPGRVLEVTRLCTDGTKNACSALYAAVARAGQAMGYEKVQTYVLETEPATSLKAAGWSFEAKTAGGAWKRADGAGRRDDQPVCPKQRWARSL